MNKERDQQHDCTTTLLHLHHCTSTQLHDYTPSLLQSFTSSLLHPIAQVRLRHRATRRNAARPQRARVYCARGVQGGRGGWAALRRASCVVTLSTHLKIHPFLWGSLTTPAHASTRTPGLRQQRPGSAIRAVISTTKPGQSTPTPTQPVKPAD